MTNQFLATSTPLPLNESLQKYLNSSNFLPNNVWKIAFSPCSQYLAIPKQDIYGSDLITIIYCPEWQANNKSDDLYVHEELACSVAVRSLAFGQRTRKSSVLNENDYLSRRRSSSVVNCRYDFTKNLFLAAGLVNGKINIWNVDTRELTLVLADHQSSVCGLAFTASTMQLASCSHDTKIKLWDLLDDGNMYKTLNEWTHVIHAVKWSPDERLLCAVGPHELVVLYDAGTWEEIFKLDGHEHSVVDCAFSSDSALLATASHDTRVLLWSTITGELMKEFAHKIPIPSKIYAGGENGSFVQSVVFANHNQFLITTCDDDTVRWFSIESNRRRGSILEKKHSHVLCLATTSNGKTMAVGTRTGEVHLWSTLSTNCEAPSLKRCCRNIINSHCGIQRREIVNLSIPKHLIAYLLYKDIKVKK